jgi:hypothetical protein
MGFDSSSLAGFADSNVIASFGQAGHGGLLDSPALDLQPTHPPKFAFIVCNQCQPCHHGMHRDLKIVVSDHFASRFHLRPNRSVRFGRRRRENDSPQSRQLAS